MTNIDILEKVKTYMEDTSEGVDAFPDEWPQYMVIRPVKPASDNSETNEYQLAVIREEDMKYEDDLKNHGSNAGYFTIDQFYEYMESRKYGDVFIKNLINGKEAAHLFLESTPILYAIRYDPSYMKKGYLMRIDKE